MEEVKTPIVTVVTDNVQDITPEGKKEDLGDKKDDVASNLSKALKLERESKKELLEKIKAYEDEKKAIEEDKLKKNGEYETLLSTYKTDLETYKAKAEKLDLYEQTKAEQLTNELTSLEKEIGDDIKTKYSTILSKLDVEGQVSFYKTLKDDLKVNDFSTQPRKGSDKLELETKKQELIKKGDVLGVLNLIK